MSLWAVGVSHLNREANVVSRAVSRAGVLPALLVTMGIIGPLNVAPDGLYLVYVLSFLGTIVWCVMLGVSLVRQKAPMARLSV